ncbi:hypothetical protein CW304_32825, partial [Bacillus sp. UFRGS-B20]
MSLPTGALEVLLHQAPGACLPDGYHSDKSNHWSLRGIKCPAVPLEEFSVVKQVRIETDGHACACHRLQRLDHAVAIAGDRQTPTPRRRRVKAGCQL